MKKHVMADDIIRAAFRTRPKVRIPGLLRELEDSRATATHSHIRRNASVFVLGLLGPRKQ